MRATNYFSVSSVKKLMYAAVIALSVGMMSLGVLMSTSISAQSNNSSRSNSSSSSRDCDNNAVIRCGVGSVSELKQKLSSNSGAAVIFAHFGISSQDISKLTNSNTAEGTVTKGGRVIVNGKTVATGAVTAGRQKMSGDTPVTKGGMTFYERKPSTSFQSNSLKAFVVTDKDGKFLFAIIASCGNPVKANPTSPKKEQREEQPQTTTPTPSQPQPTQSIPTETPQQSQSQQQSSTSSATANANVTINNEKPQQSVPVEQEQPQTTTPTPSQPESRTVVVEKPNITETPPAEVAPTPTPTEQPAQELPKTGMETVGASIGLAGAVALVSALIHYIYTRKRYN